MISISLWASALRPPHGAELLVSLGLTPLLPSLQLPVGPCQAWFRVSLCPGEPGSQMEVKQLLLLVWTCASPSPSALCGPPRFILLTNFGG